MGQFCYHNTNASAWGVYAYVCSDPWKPDCFARGGFVFHDHDVQNLFWDSEGSQWVDLQIMFQNWTTQGFRPADQNHTLKYCDNAGCIFRRVISTRTSLDGLRWSNSSGCNQTFINGAAWGQENYCTVPGGWNTSGLILPDGQDPPELQFYQFTVFNVGDSGRLAGHALLYAPAPMESLGVHYGKMVHGVACGGAKGLAHCHGPHMYTERFIGPTKGGPTNLQGWQRPFRRQRLSPRGAYFQLGAGPVTWNDTHAWVAAGDLWGVPLYRVAGLYSPANSEFSTSPFAWPDALWLNADAHWEQTGGTCDEKCQAYIMVEVRYAASQKVVAGYEREKCVFMNVDGLRLPLVWSGAPPIKVGIAVQLRIYYRDAVIYAIGANK
eukprot:NODE_200_length_1216_cov_795.913453_g159_i0.p1 GENE.NODE_200_length_1216_cov_795.913453_g159_i0~~NODE_200_length_1216_cov_795.913453_g159_i0.p1  ORF type:complete len:389 (+),score=76.14 NODE_200_length_1216_cov_795.913453_g159_i0:30-1169(+)